MKNRVRFAVAALAVILFAACFFVSCSDEVVVEKSDNYSYTEVLESNGAFVYKEKRYETLQTVIDAIAEDGGAQEGPVTLAGDVRSRAVTVPEGVDLIIDLSGHEIQFYDIVKNDADKDAAEPVEVAKGAITLLKGASLEMYNGSVYLYDRTKDLVAISANGNNNVILYGLEIAAEDQTALLLDEGSYTVLTENVTVYGSVVAKGGSDKTKMWIENNLSDVRMEGASLVVAGTGSAVITENIGENKYEVSYTGTIIDETPEDQKIDPEDIEYCICIIEREGAVFTFGSLKEAFASLEKDNEVIIFLGAEDTKGIVEELTLSKSAAIDLKGFSSKTNNITLADGVTLTISNSLSYTGSITSAEGGKSSLVLENVLIESPIEITGSLTATGCVFLDHIIAGGDVTLSNSAVSKPVVVTGKLTSVGAAVFADAVSAGSVEAIPDEEDFGALFYADITADDYVKLTGAEFAELEEGYIDITAGGDIELIGVDGEIGNISAKGNVSLVGDEDYLLSVTGSVTGKDIVADFCIFDSLNEESKSITGNTVNVSSSLFVYDDEETDYESFYDVESTGKDGETISSLAIVSSTGITGDLKAATGSIYIRDDAELPALTAGSVTAKTGIEITGTQKIPAIVNGDITAASLKAVNVNAYGNIALTTALESDHSLIVGTVSVSAGTVTDDGSIFSAAITASGNIALSNTILLDSDELPTTPDVTSTSGDITMDKVSGKAGALAAANISIDIDDAEKTLIFSTGTITASKNITLKGNAKNVVAVNGVDDDEISIKAASLNTTYADIAGAVVLTGSMKSESSAFLATVEAGTIEDTGSSFNGDITATGNIALTGSTMDAEDALEIETAGDIVMTLVSGTVGDMTAANITIDLEDEELEPELTTGVMTALAKITLKGDVNVEGIDDDGYSLIAKTMDSTSASIKGDVLVIEAITSDSTVFSGAVLASSVTDTESYFADDITAIAGDVILTGSTLEAGDIMAAGNIVMSMVDGFVRDLSATDITIDIHDEKAGLVLATGVISASGNVILKGDVDVVKPEEGASLTAVALDASYATIGGTVELSGAMTSAGSYFYGEISAASITDAGSTFEKDVTATTGDVTLTGSIFTSSAKIASERDVTATAGSILMTSVTGTVGNLQAGADITIDNSAATAALVTGDIEAVNAVVVTGNSTYNVTVDGTVGAVSLNATYVDVSDTVALTGDMVSASSVFSGTIAAASVTDTGSTFGKDITASTGDVTLTGSVFASLAKIEATRDVTATAGSIMMTGVTGTVGKLEAKAATADITIDNSAATATLGTAAIEAGNAVLVKGKSGYLVTVDGTVDATSLDAIYATITGAVTLTTGNLRSVDSEFKDSVELKGTLYSATSLFNSEIEAGAVIGSESTFKAAITATGNVDLSSSVFDTTAAVTAGGSILMDDVTGSVGDLAAVADVTIDNAESKAELETGDIEAGNAVSVTGNKDHDVVVDGDVTAVSLYAKYAAITGAVRISGNMAVDGAVFDSAVILGGDLTSVDSTFGNIVELGGKLTSTGSVFKGAIEAASVLDDAGSFFGAGIVANKGDVKLKGSVFDTKETVAAADSIILTRVTGSVGNLEGADDVTISNSQATGTLETGAIKADDAVTVTGKSGAVVTVHGAVTGSSLKATYAAFKENVELSSGDLTAADSEFLGSVSLPGKLTATGSLFGDTITAASVSAEGSELAGDITATKGDVVLTDSAFIYMAKIMAGPDVTATAGNILLTNVTGHAGDLEAGIKVTIANGDSAALLATKDITAEDAVSITGNSSYRVTVGTVEGSALEAEYAVFYGGITTTTGSVKVTDSVLDTDEGIDSADSIVLTTVSGAVGTLDAEGDVSITNTAATDSFATDVITAAGDVTVSGHSIYTVTVKGVSGLSLYASDVHFIGGITTTSGAVLIEDSAFDTTGAVVSAAGIEMSGVTGSVGALDAEAAVAIANADAAAELETGAITAGEAVVVTGNAKYSVTVDGTVDAASLDTVLAVVNGAVTLDGDLTSAGSVFNGAISADVVTDNGSCFYAAITADGDVTLTGSEFKTTDAVASAGSILMTTVTGSVGALEAEADVTIDNTEAEAVLETGVITAGGEVSVEGPENVIDKAVVIAGISGASLKIVDAEVTGDVDKISGDMGAVDAILDGAVTVDGLLVSADTLFNDEVTVGGNLGDSGSIFNGAVTVAGDLVSVLSGFNDTVNAGNISDGGSHFADAVVALGNVTMTSSVFADNAPVTAGGNILLTQVIGSAGNLVAEGDVTIANAKVDDSLSTGIITAGNAVSVTGNLVVVTGISGASLEITDAKVTGDVDRISGDMTATSATFNGSVIVGGNLTSAKSVFNGAVAVDGKLATGTSYFYNTIEAGDVIGSDSLFTAAIDATGDVTLTLSELSNSAPVSADGDILMTKVTGTAGNLTAEGDVTIANAEAATTFTTGAINAGGAVSVTSVNDVAKKVTVAGISGASLDITSATVTGAVTVDGTLKSTSSVFSNTIGAGVVIDSLSSFSADISAEGDVELTRSEFSSDACVTSGGDILMTRVYGAAGNLTADGDVRIENYSVVFETGVIKAGNAVSVTGINVSVGAISGASLVITDASVTGAVDKISGDMTATNALFEGSVTVDGKLTSTESYFGEAISAGIIEDSKSKLEGDVTATAGDVTLTGSSFAAAGAVKATGDILLTNVSAKTAVGALTANNVTIDNAKATAALATGDITAVDDIAVTGNSSYPVTVAGASGSAMDISYAILDGVVKLSGELTSSNSVYTINADVSASTVTDTKGTIIGDITADEDISFDSSVFATTADIASTSGDIEMKKVSGVVGTVTAYDVTINNADVTSTLATGLITAENAVSVAGKANVATRTVTIGGVTGTTLDIVNANLDGAVKLIGDLTSTNAGYSADTTVTAYSVVDVKGVISGDIVAEKDISFDSSAFNATANIGSTGGDIEMSKVSGFVGTVEASNVTINNSQTTMELKAEAIVATNAVTITGNSNRNVTITDDIFGTTLTIANAKATDVELTGALTSTDSVFAGAVSAASVKDDRGSFGGGITATADIALTGSELLSETESVASSTGNIVMKKVVGKAKALDAVNVSIDNAEAAGSLATGSITADNEVSVRGKANANIKTVTVTSISGSDLEIGNANVSGAVTLTGGMTSNDSVFGGAVSASVVADSRSTFSGSITANSGDVSLTDSKFAAGTEKNVTSYYGDINLTSVTGTAGKLSANNVTIDNAKAVETLTTGAVTAVGDVIVTGKANATTKTVNVYGISGASLTIANANVSYVVDLSGTLTSNDSVFGGAVSATVVADARSTFNGSISATTGNVTLTSSAFTAGTETAKNVSSAYGDINMTSVTGTAGALSANKVTISNAQATGSLETGAVTAVDAVVVTGNTAKSVTVKGVSGSTLEITNANVGNGGVNLSGNLTSVNSSFSGTISAAAVSDTGSTINSGSITATTGNVELTGSAFPVAYIDVTSLYGDITMTSVTGKAGDMSANTVTIDNSKAAPSAAEFRTGSIGTVGAVKLTGSALNAVEVTGTVYASKLDANFAIFHAPIIVTTENVTLTDSAFKYDAYYGDADVTATGNIVMTRVYGKAGSLTATAVTIDNAQAVEKYEPEKLETIAITASGAVSVTGNSSSLVTVKGAIKGATLVANYADMKGSIEMSTSAAATNCKIGDSASEDIVNAPTVTINAGSKMTLKTLAATTATITSPVSGSTVGTINAGTLTVTADNANLSVGTVAASTKIQINGGTYGAFTFSGSTASTITAGEFTGAFLHKGSAALTINGGFFTGTQLLKTGSTTINGTYSLADEKWNLKFEDLTIGADATCAIQSGYFEAASASQLNSIGAYIAQTSEGVSSTKFVEILYKSDTIGAGGPTTLSMSADKVKKAVVNFKASLVMSSYLYFEYPGSVELRGSIKLDSDSGQVWSYGRELNDPAGYSIVWKSGGGRITPYTGSSPYKYRYE